MASSLSLFDPAGLPSAIRYEKLFENLLELEDKANRRGRRPIRRNSLLKALIYKALRRLATLSDLAFELNNNPTVAQALGFDPLKHAPSVERFSSFLHDTYNHELQRVRIALVQSLIGHEVTSGHGIAIDSCPIVAQHRENNLKTSMANRFDKFRRPAGDSEARLGLMIPYPKPFKKEVCYFWGYRNHTVSDIDTELPLWGTTKPAHISEIRIAKSLIREAKQHLAQDIQLVLADANYDAQHFLTFVIICEAGLPMYRNRPCRL